MKIISKYKDYYDYLVGIYGEDPKIILDRRESEQLYLPLFPDKITLVIAGLVIEGYYVNNKIHYGERLLPYQQKYKYWKPKKENGIIIDRDYYSLVPFKDDKQLNKKLDCPILYLRYNRTPVKYPILHLLDLPSFIPAEEMYQMLYQYLSNQLSEKEDKVDNRNDIEKLEAKGFDKKESFRPNIK